MTIDFASIWNGEHYEDLGGLTMHITNAIITPLLNNLPRKVIRDLIAKSKGDTGKLLLTRPGSYVLFNSIYRFGEKGAVDVLDKVLNNTIAARAVRNRFLFVKEALYRMGKESIHDSGTAAFFGIGIGDGNAEIHVMRRLLDELGGQVYLVAVDHDKEAIKAGMQRASDVHVENHVLFLEGSANLKEVPDLQHFMDEAENLFGSKIKANIVINIGLNQYLDVDPGSHGVARGSDEIIGLLTSYYNLLDKGGWILSDNTDFHDRIPFLERSLDWFCSYRSLDVLTRLVSETGFRVEYHGKDPTGHSNIVIGRK